MIRSRILSLFFPICLAFSACGIKTKFNTAELQWLNMYKEGDTLIFRSTEGELDTSVILKKVIYYPDYNPVEVHDRYLPQTGEIWYTNKYLTYNPDGSRMISMIKKRPNKETGMYLSYLNNGVIVENISTDFKKYKHAKVYVFDCFNSRAKRHVPKMIHWHEDYGIIKYITHGGIEWNRINLKDSGATHP